MMKGSMEVQFQLHKKDFKETDHLKDHFHGKELYRTSNVWPLARGFKLYKLSAKSSNLKRKLRFYKILYSKVNTSSTSA